MPGSGGAGGAGFRLLAAGTGLLAAGVTAAAGKHSSAHLKELNTEFCLRALCRIFVEEIPKGECNVEWNEFDSEGKLEAKEQLFKECHLKSICTMTTIGWLWCLG